MFLFVVNCRLSIICNQQVAGSSLQLFYIYNQQDAYGMLYELIKEKHRIFRYNVHMKTKTLRETNPYLQDEAMRKKLVSRSVRTSCGVEGIKLSGRVGRIEITHRKNKRIYKAIQAQKTTKA